MRAYIHKLKPDGLTMLGTENARITKDYRHWSNLLNYATRGLKPGWYLIEAFNDWDRRYGEPDKTNRCLIR